MAWARPARRTRLSGGGALIFLTVGTHEPFDRLVRALDAWAAGSGRGAEIFGQITGRAGYCPAHFDWVPAMPPAEYRDRIATARLVVSHAGMGSILTAFAAGRPILVMPRRGHLGETRNDHQHDTVQALGARPGLHIAGDETDLGAALDRLTGTGAAEPEPIGAYADDGLIGALRDLIGGTGR